MAGIVLFVLTAPCLGQTSPSSDSLKTTARSDSTDAGAAGLWPVAAPGATTDSAGVVETPATVVATTAHSPRSALWRSAVLPGWGQWRGGHAVKGVLFAGAAAGWLGAVVVEHGRIGDAPTAQLHQDRVGRRNTKVLWYVITATAAALDAYVDAHLDDFDVDEGFSIEVRPPARRVAADGGGTWMASLSLAF